MRRPQELCDQLLQQNPLDKAAWLLKTRALTAEVATDDAELEAEGLAELALDDTDAVAMARPWPPFGRCEAIIGWLAADRPGTRMAQAPAPVSSGP